MSSDSLHFDPEDASKISQTPSDESEGRDLDTIQSRSIAIINTDSIARFDKIIT